MQEVTGSSPVSPTTPGVADPGSASGPAPTWSLFVGAWAAISLVLLWIARDFVFGAPMYEWADFAANALQIDRAKHFSELLGNYSRFNFHHPGPAFFYVYAASEVLFHDLLGVAAAPMNAHLLGSILLQSAFIAGAAVALASLPLIEDRRRFLAAAALTAMIVLTLAQHPELSIWPPYVLVGHSLGGPYIMTYTKTFGSDVAGLVFVDASHPDQVQRFKGVLPDPGGGQGMMKVAAALSWTGVVRIVVRGMPAPPKEPASAFQAMQAYAPTSLGSMLKESDAIDTTMAQAGAFRQLGDRPVVVLTANQPMPKDVMAQLKITPDQAAKFQALWRTLHDEEASWSSKSRHELVLDATHYIQFDRPDVVIRAVREVVDSVRARPGT